MGKFHVKADIGWSTSNKVSRIVSPPHVALLVSLCVQNAWGICLHVFKQSLKLDSVPCVMADLVILSQSKRERSTAYAG